MYPSTFHKHKERNDAILANNTKVESKSPSTPTMYKKKGKKKIRAKFPYKSCLSWQHTRQQRKAAILSINQPDKGVSLP